MLEVLDNKPSILKKPADPSTIDKAITSIGITEISQRNHDGPYKQL
jgi:hypothetical protein